MATTLIKKGRIVTAVDDYSADIVIVDGRIQTIGKNIAVGTDAKVHDANGLLVLPGGLSKRGEMQDVDLHQGPSLGCLTPVAARLTPD